jgi:hypothetical protein
MKEIDRRKALSLLAIGAASFDVMVHSANGQELPQGASDAGVRALQTSPSLLAPSPIVEGTYEATYQEGYASALLGVGFTEDVLLEMFSIGPQHMTVAATNKTLWLGTTIGGPELQIALGSPTEMQIFGTSSQIGFR